MHEIPAGGASPHRYHRMTFHRHKIFIQDAGGMLERSVRNSRGDREKSARTLLDERAEIMLQYERSLAVRRARFREIGVPAAEMAALDPERAPLMQKPGLWLRTILHRGDALLPLARRFPVLQMDIDLWKMERDGLRKRMAALSVEVHKKFALPAACIVFVLIGAPIGMRVKRAGPAVAFLSIGFFLFYYICLVGGEELAKRLLLPPWLAIWLANIVLGLLGVDLTARACDVTLPWHRRATLAATPANGIVRDGNAAA